MRQYHNTVNLKILLQNSTVHSHSIEALLEAGGQGSSVREIHKRKTVKAQIHLQLHTIDHFTLEMHIHPHARTQYLPPISVRLLGENSSKKWIYIFYIFLCTCIFIIQ